MEESYKIETLEQLRAVADVLRLRIIDTLQQRPMTVTQLGEALGEAPAKVHYHVRELEKVGLLRLVETREKGGILEKYYQPVARIISVGQSLLTSPADEVAATAGGWIDQIRDGFLTAYRVMRAQQDEEARQELFKRLSYSLCTLYLTTDEVAQLTQQISELCKPYETRRGIEGERESMLSLLLYPHHPAQAVTPAEEPEPRNITVVGEAIIRRAALEQALAEGRPLHIRVIGICRFAADVDAELAARAIERINVTGTLRASPEVRAVLQEKQAASLL